MCVNICTINEIVYPPPTASSERLRYLHERYDSNMLCSRVLLQDGKVS